MKIEKEYVPYEQSLALKELEFDELCICIYNREKALRANVFNNSNDRFKSVQLSYNNGKIPAPLYQQSFRWFREKYGLSHYNIRRDYNISEDGVRSYDDIELECIKKLIEIVKNK